MGTIVTKRSGEEPKGTFIVSGKEVELEEAITLLLKAVPTVMQENVPPLIRAAASRDRKSVRRLVESEDGLNAPNDNGQTPLHWAVIVQGEPILESLITLGRSAGGASRFRLDAAEEHSFTALHYAAVTRNSFATHVLLETGASVDCRDEGGETPLMKAAKWDDVAQCRVLLDAGADATAADSTGRSALHLAAASGNAGVVSLLLERGAAAGAVDAAGRSALCYALSQRHLDAARVLLPAVAFAASPPQADNTGRLELHWAAAHGTPDIVEKLLSFGQPRWHQDLEGMTPLHRALEARNEAAAEVLLQEQCRLWALADRRGMTAAHWAARAGLARVLVRLQAAGVDALAVDREGRDPLMWALRSGDPETVSAVLGHDGFRQRADRAGRTALHVAAMRGDAVGALALLQHGADPDVEDGQGLTPLAWALHNEQDAVVDVLRCYSAEEPTLDDLV